MIIKNTILKRWKWEKTVNQNPYFMVISWMLTWSEIHVITQVEIVQFLTIPKMYDLFKVFVY